jgi:toxin ParE1/3/4
MRIRYTVRARADLEEIRSYLLRRNPRAAVAVVTAIRHRISWLADFPLMAPETDERGVRELPLVRYPYRVYYEVVGDEVRILMSDILEGILGERGRRSFRHGSNG